MATTTTMLPVPLPLGLPSALTPPVEATAVASYSVPGTVANYTLRVTTADYALPAVTANYTLRVTTADYAVPGTTANYQ